MKRIAFFVLLLIFPFSVFSISISPDRIVDNSQNLIITCDTDANHTTLIYDQNGNLSEGNGLDCPPQNPLRLYPEVNNDLPSFLGDGNHMGPPQNGQWTLIEIDQGIKDAETFGSDHPTVATIDSDPALVSKINFNIRLPLSGLFQDADPSGITSYRPEVNIISPKEGSVFSTEANLKYEATDQNDLGVGEEKTNLGLSTTPVSIFYSDKIDDWDHSLLNDDLKIFVQKSLPAVGSYLWNTKNLIQGVFYRVVVDAVDVAGLVGENVSDFFTVDFTPPVFTIKADPPAVRSGAVTIIVDSSKSLSSPPSVTVTQREGAPVKVSMKGEGNHYEGTYTVTSLHDGTAKISVFGEDIAGNKSTTVVGGGTFSVGVDAPPQPRITLPEENSVSKNEFIKVTGTSREDTTVFLSVNGATSTQTKPDSNGNFVFDKVKLEKNKNYGLNFLSITAKDANDALSETNTIKVKYNIAPVISVTSPKPGEIIGGLTSIVTSASDENTDPLIFTYQIVPINEYVSTLSPNWINIGDRIPVSRFLWNSTEVDDGEYILRVLADDSTTVSTTTPISIIIKNTLPFFRFEDGRKTVTNKSTVKITGRAITPDNISPRPVITAIEYSTDNGKKWRMATTTDTTLDSGEEKFEVSFNKLSQGTYPITWRVTDSRGLSNKINHPIIVDTTPPATPEISFPQKNSLITNDDDEDRLTSGIQITVYGKAEGGSTVSALLDDKIYTAKASPDGNYILHGVTALSRGSHDLNVYAADGIGNKSKERSVSFVYNNPPKVTFIHPAQFRGIGGVKNGKEEIIWKVEDLDNDKIENTVLSYRKGTTPFTLLSKDIPQNKFSWDISGLSEGNDYELKLDLTDGISAVSARDIFSVDRTLPPPPSFSLKNNVIGKNDFLEAYGSARDENSGVEFVEYSILAEGVGENPADWFKALISKGFLQKQATFTVNYPLNLNDGRYNFFARTVDAAGNISKDTGEGFLVDTLPPRIGSFMAKANGVNVAPDNLGILSVYKGSQFIFAISLEDDTKDAQISFGGSSTDLKKEISSGLWEATSTTVAQGDADIFISAEDVVGNSLTDKKVGVLHSIPNGKVSFTENDISVPLSLASIRVQVLDDGTKHFSNFKVLGNDLVVTTDSLGEYSLALPTGTYKIIAEKKGFKVVAEEVTLTRPGFVGANFVTEKYSGIRGFFDSIIDWIYY